MIKLLVVGLLASAVALQPQGLAAQEPPPQLRAGIIGLDTSHAIAFTRILNAESPRPEFAGCRVVAAYPQGSRDIPGSFQRVPEYVEQMKAMGVEIVPSLEELLARVDVVMLETNDGRPHLEQAIPVLKAGKRLFVDKPVAGSLADAIALYETARRCQTPVFSSSALRFTEGAQAIRGGAAGAVLGCDAYSPASLEATHPDLFWYGIHGVETLFTCMGTGIERVVRMHADDADVVVGQWQDGRLGTFRGTRSGKGGYGGTAFGAKEIRQIGSFGGYEPLMVQIVAFFRGGEPPVAAEETLEIYAFMEAADESKRRGGQPVTVAEVMDRARAEAEAKVAR